MKNHSKTKFYCMVTAEAGLKIDLQLAAGWLESESLLDNWSIAAW
jgi:hypothetical protein